MPRKSTHEEFMEKFYIKNENAKNIEILGKYEGSKIKIKCKCKIDGHEWEIRPNDLLKGIGCPKCAGNRKGNIMRKSHEKFIKDFMKKNSHAENIEILGEYKRALTKIKCKCKIDGHEWEVAPHDLLKGIGCPKCAGRDRTTEEFKQEMKKVNDNIEILGEYVSSQTKIKCKCKLDGYEWEAIPSHLLRNHGCPKCYGNTNKTTEEFKQEMKEVNDNIEILGEYFNNKTKIKCKCKIDGHEWSATPNRLLSGTGCPKCDESKGEKRVAEYLDSKNIEYERQYKFNDCRSKKKLPFDFYIPSLNIAVEYDGEYHYMIINIGKNDTYEKAFNRFIEGKVRDTIKTIYCKENNIKLIRIPYWEYDRIEEILEKEF